MRRCIGRAVLVAMLAVALAGCDNVDESIPTTPPPPDLVSETLTGSITVNGAETKTFTVATSGTLTATLSAATRQDGADQTITVGLGIGTWNGAICQVVLPNDAATVGTTVVGNVSGAGTLCIRVYDVGQLTAPINYTVDLVHP